jgi:hypothetical protein
MKKIYKYSLEVEDIQRILLPIDAKILTVQVQNEKPCLWALVDPENNTEARIIEIFGTGNLVSDYADISIEHIYIATFQLYEGKLVFHVFEQKQL